MASLSVAVNLLLLSILSSLCLADVGLSCKDHLASDVTSTPVLIRSWEFLGKRTAIFVNNRITYTPRLTRKLNYVPITASAPVSSVPSPAGASPSPGGVGPAAPLPEDSEVDPATIAIPLGDDDLAATLPPTTVRAAGDSESKYKGLDFFVMAGNRNVRSKFALKMYFQRAAKIYLFVNTNSYDAANPPEATLPGGWQSEGWADLRKPRQALVYGVYQKTAFVATQYSYVFSRRSRGRKHVVFLPHVGWVNKNIRGITSNGQFHCRIAEADGSASVAPGLFRGAKVRPNAKCPDILHRAWSTPDSNTADPYTAGRRYGTWHPVWDPCYWCTFGHDHGSSAPALMDYDPKYGLTEEKYTGGIESNPGFKDTVIKQDGLLIYFSEHVQTSSLRRVRARFHTVTVVIKDASTKELLAELSFKGDFGFLAARRAGANNRFVAVTPEGETIFAEQKQKIPFLRKLRTINVIKEGDLNPAYRYQTPLLEGTYEEWITIPPCTKAPRGGELVLDVQDPITAVREVPGDTKVALGVIDKPGPVAVFRRHISLRRTLRANNLEVSAAACGFDGGFDGGEFYTDPEGKELRNGPGQDHVKQYIKKGWSTKISGRWQVGLGNLWLGAHVHGSKEFFYDQGYGVSPEMN